jgi:hypothetical protein
MERKIAGRTAEGGVNIEKLISNIIWLPVLFVLTVGEKLRKKEVQKDFCKNGFCMAKQYSKCKNFQPVHDLGYCKYVGLGWTCDFEGEDER